MQLWAVTNTGIKDALLVPGNFGLCADIHDLPIPVQDKIPDLERLEDALKDYDYIYIDYKYVFPIYDCETRSAEGIGDAKFDRECKNLCWRI